MRMNCICDYITVFVVHLSKEDKDTSDWIYYPFSIVIGDNMLLRRSFHLSVLLISGVLRAASELSGDDPLATPEGYLKYDIKKGASFNPEVLTNQSPVFRSRDLYWPIVVRVCWLLEWLRVWLELRLPGPAFIWETLPIRGIQHKGRHNHDMMGHCKAQNPRSGEG